MSFTVKIVVGLILGVGAGLFLGELAAPFSIGGEVFIGLLQMTVLPYIVVSLISNIGRITWSERSGLLLAGIVTLTLLLMLGIVILLVIPLAFPPWESASFFSSSLVSAPKQFDFVNLYIPSNPFASLSENVVPAAVLFSIFLGIGLGGVKGNAGVLHALEVIASGLNQINKLVIKATPVGVFAIAAGTAGTISIDEVSRLQAYLITYTVIALVMALLVLPLLVSAVTPFSYRDIIGVPKATLITIFAAAKIIIVLPQLADNVKELFRRYDLEDEDVDSGADILMPLAYPFPNLGTYIILMFIPFSVWYLGREMGFADEVVFQASALLSSFVAPIIGVPFLLDVLQIPADMMELFVMSTVYTDRIRVVLGAVHLFALVIVAVAISRGVFQVHKRKLLLALGISVAAISLSLFAVRGYLSYAVSGEYRGDQALVEMRWMDRPVPARQYHNGELPPAEPAVQQQTRLQVITERGSLRVGYLRDSLPFAFRNGEGEVVGLDVELAHQLASDLDVELELVRVPRSRLEELLARGHVDIVMSGLAVTPRRAMTWHFSEPVMDVTLAFLVPDYRRKLFSEYEPLRRQEGLRIGIVQGDAAFTRRLAFALPRAELVDLDSPRPFLRGELPELDAMVYSAEGGSAWTLIYPQYSVVVPQPSTSQVPLAYPLPAGDVAWERYVSTWIDLQRKSGAVNDLVEHWIQGGGALDEAPRWSVIRDVLGWVD